jgi:hypothetical protein
MSTEYEVTRIIPKTYDPNAMGGMGVETMDANADVTTPNSERE